MTTRDSSRGTRLETADAERARIDFAAAAADVAPPPVDRGESGVSVVGDEHSLPQGDRAQRHDPDSNAVTNETRRRISDLDAGDTSTRGSHAAHDLGDSGAEPGDLVEFIAAESAEVEVDDGVPGRGWRGRLAQLARQLVKFGLVGGVGFVIDMGLYNVLVLTVLSPETVAAGPILAKVLSTLAAITTNWIGNRLWTFRHHRRHDSAREAAEFFAVSLAGLVVGLLPLWISHYLIGWTSLLSDNIANVVGLGLGSVFRFSLYRLWVFSPLRRGARAPLPADSRGR